MLIYSANKLITERTRALELSPRSISEVREMKLCSRTLHTAAIHHGRTNGGTLIGTHLRERTRVARVRWY